MAREPNAKIGLTLRLPERLRERLEKESEASLTSLNNEILRRLDESFDRETLLQSILNHSRSTDMLKAIHAVTDKLSRTGRNMVQQLPGYKEASQEFLRGHELATRREIHAAIAVISAVYMATEEPRPVDRTQDDLPVGAWGAGDIGRERAYWWLEWNDDIMLERAKSTSIEAYWTGDGESLGDLEMTPEQVEWRRFQGSPPAPLADRYRDANVVEKRVRATERMARRKHT